MRLDGRLHWSTTGDDNGVLPGNAQFPIYSITKTLTAICVLRSSELGTLSVNDRVTKWLPDVAIPNEIAVAHLLRHTSGLRDYGPLAEYHDAVRAHPAEPWTRAQFLHAVLSRGMLFKPGEGWSYSNVGYMLLREILQRVTGRSFVETVDEFVVRPLALRQTRGAETIDAWSICVPGYGPEVDLEGRRVDVRHVYHPGWCAPGVAVSTAEEITLVIDALLTGRILKPRTLDEMLTLTPIPDPQSPHASHGYGMGIASDYASSRGPNYGHGGGGPGYDLDVTIFTETPTGRLAIAVFVSDSGGRGWAQDCEAQLLASLLEECR